MPTSVQRWKRLGRILAPDPAVPWMVSHTGAAFPVRVGETSRYDLFLTGRDAANRSLIGKVRFDIADLKAGCEVSAEPVLGCGELGAFDENGVSYPFLVRRGEDVLLYYVGWMPSVLTPFQNQVGVAVETEDGVFQRVSRAPILERTNDDFLSMGSIGILVEEGLWRMWYTSFVRWGEQEKDQKHVYVIKYAESDDGIKWRRNNTTCIDITGEDEYAICRPTVRRDNGLYHMWYCTRGAHYRIGYASSPDGIHWNRKDESLEFAGPEEQWDSLSRAYPNVFEHDGKLFMFYCGNNYGKDGIGLAVLDSGR